MSIAVLLPALTSLLAFVFALALLDQWLERRRGFQLIWALGMLFFGVAVGVRGDRRSASIGWSELLYRTWYLTGAVLTAGGWAWARPTCWARRALATPTPCSSSSAASSRSLTRNTY